MKNNAMNKNRDTFHFIVSVLTLMVLLAGVGGGFWWASDINRRTLALEECKISIVNKADAAERRIGSLESGVAVLQERCGK